MKRWLSNRLRPRDRTREAEEAVARHRGGIRAITDAPPPRTAKWLLTAMMLVLAAVVIWASLSRMEVVAFAQGRTVVSSRVQPVQSVERARVSDVLVEEGDRVRADQEVIHLERADVEARVDELEFRLEKKKAANERINSLLQAEPGQAPKFEAPDGIRSSIVQSQRTYMQTQWQRHRRRLAELEQQLANQRAEVATTEAKIESLNEVRPILAERYNRYKSLREQDAAAVTKLDDARRQLIDNRNERQIEKRRLDQVKGQVDLTQRKLKREKAKFAADLQDELSKNREEMTRIREKLAKARVELERHTLRAPIAGYVQDVAVNNSGTVVEPAKVLMRIVPADRPVEVEAEILNKDIGFAREGHTVDVKFDAFDFTRYGAVPGVIREISRTSTEKEKKGRVYTALVELKRNFITVDGEKVRVRPGMTTTVDIETGSRRVISYFLGPIMRYSDKALSER